MRYEKNELLKHIRENPTFVQSREKYKNKKTKINAAKLIQKVYRNILARTKQYSVKLILYRAVSLDDPQLYEGIEKGNIEAVKEIYRRKKKFFFKNVATFNSVLNKYVIENLLFVQLTYPTSISVKFTDKELEKYNKKYTLRTSVVTNDLKFNQLTLDT